MSEVCQAGGALTQSELEGRDRRQLRPQPQDLQQLAGRAVGCDDAFTESVGKERSFRSIVCRKAGHDNGTECNDKTNPPNLKNRRKSLSRWHSRRFVTPAEGTVRLQACRDLAKTVSE